jgi:hypothetical protein
MGLLAVVVLGVSRFFQAWAAAGRKERFREIAEDAAAAQNAAASQLADVNARLHRVEKILASCPELDATTHHVRDFAIMMCELQGAWKSRRQAAEGGM